MQYISALLLEYEFIKTVLSKLRHCRNKYVGEEMALTKKQQEVVDSEKNRLLVLSCAGSGKTTTITYRIAKLWKKGVKPEEILALTFSNKAAQEMKHKVCKENAKLGARVNVRTFHSFGLDIIKRYNVALGFTGPVKIASASIRKGIIKEILKRNDQLDFEGKAVEEYLKNGKSCEKFRHLPDFEEIFNQYNEELLNNNLVDMDDMIWIPVKFLLDNEAVRKHIADQYKYIFVDEYQDTNEAQNKLLDLITNEKSSLCLVGDDDQAIYEWRGAKPRYIRDKAESGEYTVIKLETNFRSQQGVIDAANRVIKNNEKRVIKDINSNRPLGIKPIYKRFQTQIEEASFVGDTIKELIDNDKFNPSDIAVLCRVNNQIEPIKTALGQRGINTDLCEIDENSKYSRFIGVLQAIIDMNSPQDVGSALNFPNICLDNFVFTDAKRAYCDKYGQDCNYGDIEWLYNLYASDVIFENCEEFRERFGLINKLHTADTWTPTQVVALYIKYMQTKEYDLRFPEEYHFLLQVFDIAQNYEETFGEVTLKDFLNHLNLTMGLGDIAEGTDCGAVNVLTMHRSKGLEYKVVFIVGVQVGIMPNDYFIHTTDDLEAERRLFYVALTRAKDLLYLTSYQDPFGGSVKSDIVTHGFMAEIPQISFCNMAEYSAKIRELPPKENVHESDNLEDEIKKVVEKKINKTGINGQEYDEMVELLVKDSSKEKIDRQKPHHRTNNNSTILRRYRNKKIEELSIGDFIQIFKMASIENISMDMAKAATDLSEAISSLAVVLKKYPEEKELTQKFFDYYIPEAISLFFEYLDYDKGTVASEILEPVYESVMASMLDVNFAISSRVDDIYRIATLDTKAKAIALQRIIAQDGYEQ